ncbi:MAG TPA: sigma-70 family RNA polymerase sigma factor [Chloroflexia bacterium]|nr:sigma-70 family RNA polymerase sigma factor [Chloroflexia bacterium]
MLDLSPIADDQLMQNVARGDATSLEVLYDRYVRQCFGLALRLLNNPQIAEEVVQEVFTKLWSRPDSYSVQKGKFASWLLSLVHHRCIDELRRRSNNEARLEDPVTGSLLDTQLDPAPDPSDQVTLMEQQVAVRAALQELAPNQREVLLLAYFRGLSQSQIASELKQPLGTVKTRVRMGLQKLKSLLDARGISVEEDG